jgi:hypothetical protein
MEGLINFATSSVLFLIINDSRVGNINIFKILLFFFFFRRSTVTYRVAVNGRKLCEKLVCDIMTEFK